VEYIIDELNMTATMVKRWRNEPDIYGVIMGNAQEVETGGRVVGWGSGVPGITEFHEDGSIALEVYIDNFNYRAFRYDWETTAFEFSTDTLDFGEIYYQGSGKKTVTITNNTYAYLEINHVQTRTPYFVVDEEELPIYITPTKSQELSFYFYPDAEGEFTDVLTICSNDDYPLIQRIARQLPVKALATEDAGFGELNKVNLMISPNPSGDGIFMFSGVHPGEIKMITILSPEGTIVARMKDFKGNQLDLSDYAPGIYIVHINLKNTTISKRIIRL
jgi:hypothetical protein